MKLPIHSPSLKTEGSVESPYFLFRWTLCSKSILFVSIAVIGIIKSAHKPKQTSMEKKLEQTLQHIAESVEQVSNLFIICLFTCVTTKFQ